ncbi:MAG: hypothetical protein RQ930_02395 [Candidatus Aenigmarchaeota archaeon]|jgi:hypothetical protein|nr:hypothetical protein [Candidatus Aenigmarchaeota archaeon]
MKGKQLDILKIGVFLVGISALIFAGLATHWYYKLNREYREIPSNQFFSYCNKDVIIISAYSDLKDVKVLDENGNTVCSFDLIRKNSDEICKTNRYGVFLVASGDLKKAIICENISRPLPQID